MKCKGTNIALSRVIKDMESEKKTPFSYILSAGYYINIHLHVPSCFVNILLALWHLW
jgi:hypothetical protein